VIPLTLIAVGFVMAMVLVIVLARTSTARWEEAGRAARAPRPQVIAPGAALVGHAHPPPRAARRGIAAASGRLDPLRALLKRGAARLPKLVASRERLLVRADTTHARVALAPNRPRGPRARRGDGAVGRRLLHRLSSRPRHRARHFLHRHDDIDDARAVRADTDESPTGR
jgi:hypothetical protein